MNMRTKRWIYAVSSILGIFLLASPAPARDADRPATVATAQPVGQTIDAFWANFRANLLDKRVGESAGAIADTLIQRGTLDDGPRRKLKGPARLKAVEAALEADTGLLATPQTQRDLIAATQTVTEKMKLGPKQFRVGNMLFQQTAQGWRLVQIYVEE